MGVMPLIDVFGFGLGVPTLWPMGVGAGEPSALFPESRARRFQFTWAGGRLARVDMLSSVDELVRRTTYSWTGDQLDRVDYDERGEDGLGGPDGTPDFSSVWSWRGGRPVRREALARDGAVDTIADWKWATDGRSVEIAEQSEAGLIATRTVRFDPAGRLESVATLDGKTEQVSRLEVSWHPDGRVASARQWVPTMDAPLDITFKWAEGGRLVEQTSNIHGTPRRWFYRYGDEEAR